jgi:hypothetical protein
MNGFTRTPRSIRARRSFWLGLIALGAALLGSNSTKAAAIHHVDKTSAVDPASFRTWSEYLLGGPTVWASVAHPALTPAIEASMWKAIKSDPPPDTDAVVQFFLWKQSLDPARFDHFHPNVAAAMSKIKAELATATPATVPSTGTSSPTDEAQTLTPPAVPEPATLYLTIGMAGYALWWRRRRT